MEGRGDTGLFRTRNAATGRQDPIYQYTGSYTHTGIMYSHVAHEFVHVM